MTTPTPTEADKRAAESIYKAEWSTQEAIWPGVPEVAQIIATAMQPEREALRLAKQALIDVVQDGLQTNVNGWRVRAVSALTAIEKVTG